MFIYLFYFLDSVDYSNEQLHQFPYPCQYIIIDLCSKNSLNCINICIQENMNLIMSLSNKTNKSQQKLSYVNKVDIII